MDKPQGLGRFWFNCIKLFSPMSGIMDICKLGLMPEQNSFHLSVLPFLKCEILFKLALYRVGWLV